MAESFENLDDNLADWVNDDFEKSLVEAEDSYDKKEKERKTRFSVENELKKLLEQSQSNETKRNTKWVVKLFQDKRPLLCFEINEVNKQKLSEIDLLDNSSRTAEKNVVLRFALLVQAWKRRPARSSPRQS